MAIKGQYYIEMKKQEGFFKYYQPVKVEFVGEKMQLFAVGSVSNASGYNNLLFAFFVKIFIKINFQNKKFKIQKRKI